MNNKFFTILLISISFCFLLGSCSEKKEKYNIQIKDLYIETIGFSPELKSCFDRHFFVQHKKDTVWFLPDTVIYQYKDANTLSENNLKDYTKKLRITLLEKDSIGNQAFRVEIFRTEGSEWKRRSNSGLNSLHKDSLIALDQLCNVIARSTYVYILKFNP